jgi:hypothetical protein
MAGAGTNQFLSPFFLPLKGECQMMRTLLIAVFILSVVVVLSGCPKPAEQPIPPPPPSAPAPPPAATPPPAPEKPAADTPAADKPGADKAPGKVKIAGEEGKPVQKTATGLQYVVLDPGKGLKPKKGEMVEAEYTGWLTDGTKFDSSKDHPDAFKFPVGAGQVIPGWDEAFLAMKEGERRKLIIPPALGYGAEGMGPIPPNATLVFEVKLIKVVK